MWNHIAAGEGGRGCILADYMGLGKTLQLVSVITSFMDLRLDKKHKSSSGSGSGSSDSPQRSPQLGSSEGASGGGASSGSRGRASSGSGGLFDVEEGSTWSILMMISRLL